jgi:hypothetical protein
LNWLLKNKISPITGNPLFKNHLIYNRALKEMITLHLDNPTAENNSCRHCKLYIDENDIVANKLGNFHKGCFVCHDCGNICEDSYLLVIGGKSTEKFCEWHYYKHLNMICHRCGYYFIILI